jgi:hypothetical protein
MIGRVADVVKIEQEKTDTHFRTLRRTSCLPKPWSWILRVAPLPVAFGGINSPSDTSIVMWSFARHELLAQSNTVNAKLVFTIALVASSGYV